VLKRIWRKTGKCPQFEFDEISNVFDLYVPLGLGFKVLSRLLYYVTADSSWDQSIEPYCPLVAKCLAGEDWGLEPDVVARVAPIVTKFLLIQSKSQQRLAHGWRLPTVKASRVRRMNERKLEFVVDQYDLDIDINEFNSLQCKATAVISGLAASGKLR